MAEIKLTKEETLEIENLNLKVQSISNQANTAIKELQGKLNSIINAVFDKNKIKDREDWNVNLEKGLLEKSKGEKPKETK